MIGKHGSLGLSHISKPVLQYSHSIRSQAGTTECTVVKYSWALGPKVNRDWT